MNKKLFLSVILVLSLVFALAGCSDVSQEDYDALVTAKSTLEIEKAALQAELDSKMVSYKDQSVEAYRFTHAAYVGKVTIVVTDGVVDVEINEAFLPHTLAAVMVSTLAVPTVWNETNTITIGTSSYAQYILYNGTVFKALKTDAGVLVYSVVDETGALKTGRFDNKNLEMSIINDDASMKAYYDALNAGEFKLLKSFDDTTPIAITENQFKDGNPNYWQPNATSLGWQRNIDLIEAFLEEYGAAFDTLTFTKVLTTLNEVEDNYWQIGDIQTGATNSDFQDYFQLAQTAFGQLETEVK